MKKKDQGRRRQHTAAIVAHFVALMHARERGDLAMAGHEQDVLDRLGVRVRITSRKGAADAS